MSKKMVVVVLAVVLVNIAMAADQVWSDGSGDQKWDNPANWLTVVDGVLVPSTDAAGVGAAVGDSAYLGGGGALVGPMIDETMNIQLLNLGGPGWATDNDLTMTGGNLTLSGDWTITVTATDHGCAYISGGTASATNINVGAAHDGAMYLSGDASVTATTRLWMGLGTGAASLIEITDNASFYAANLARFENQPTRIDVSGNGSFSVGDPDGGLAYWLTQWTMTAGFLSVNGVSDVGLLNVEWNGVDTTTVTAIPEPATLALLSTGLIALIARKKS